MALITCKECSKEYSDTAAACPSCGARIKKPRLWLRIPLALAALFFAWAALRDRSPEEIEMAQQRSAVKLCWEEQARKSNSVGSAQFIAGACERMETEFEKKYGHKP